MNNYMVIKPITSFKIKVIPKNFETLLIATTTLLHCIFKVLFLLANTFYSIFLKTVPAL